MAKFLRRSLLVALLLLLAAAALGFAFRTSLAEQAILAALEARGISDASVTVDRLSYSRLSARTISLGADKDLSLDQLVLRYHLPDLVQGTIGQITLKNLNLRLDLTADAQAIHPLMPLLEELTADDRGDRPTAGTETDPKAVIPTMLLEDAAITLASDHGAMTLTLNGEVWPDIHQSVAGALSFGLTGDLGEATGLLALSSEEGPLLLGQLIVEQGHLSLPNATAEGLAGETNFLVEKGNLKSVDANFALAGLSLPGRGDELTSLDRADLTLSMVGDDLTFEGALVGLDNRFSGTVKGEVKRLLESSRATLEGTVVALADSEIWTALGVAAPTSGQGEATFDAVLRLPPLDTLLEGEADLADALMETVNLTGRLGIELADVSYPDLVEGLNGSAAVRINFSDETASLILERPSSWSATRLLAVDRAAVLGVPADLASGFSDEVSLTIESRQGDGFLAASHPDTSSAGDTNAGAPDRVGLVDVTLSATSKKGASLRLTGALEATLDAADALTGFDLRDFGLEAGGLVIAGTPLRGARLEGNLAGSPDQFAGKLAATLDVPYLDRPPLRASGLEADLKGTLSYSPDGLFFEQSGSGGIKLATFEGPGGLALAAPLHLQPQEMTLRRIEEAERALLDLRLTVEQVNAKLVKHSAEQDPRAFAIDVAGLVLTGQVDAANELILGLESRAVTVALSEEDPLGAQGATADGLTASVTTKGDRLRARFAVDSLAQASDAPVIEPLALQGNIDRNGAVVEFSLKGGWPGAEGEIVASGSYDIEKASLVASSNVGPILFSPDALQPADLSGRAAALEKTTGIVEASVILSWQEESGLGGTATLQTRNFGFVVAEVPVVGLALDLTLSDLATLSSPPDQVLTIKSIDPGLPLTDFDLRFALRASAPPSNSAAPASGLPVIEVTGGGFDVLRSHLTIEPTSIDLSGDRQAMTLAIEKLGMEELFAALEAKGLAGSGQLDGVIPLRFEQGQLVIEGGHLAATGPGRLQYKSDEATALLAGSADQVDMMLRALEDFHYEVLELELDKTATDDLTARLSLLGSNPTVLEGHPFKININLESNIGQILQTIADGYKISREALRQAWQRTVP